MIVAVATIHLEREIDDPRKNRTAGDRIAELATPAKDRRNQNWMGENR
jgi:hypothetical protein